MTTFGANFTNLTNITNITNLSTTPSQLILWAIENDEHIDDGSDSIILDTFVNLFWYIIASVIFCIICISGLLIFYIQQTRRYKDDDDKEDRRISESLQHIQYHHHTITVQSNTSKHKLVISAPLESHTRKSLNHSRVISAFSTISALSGLHSPRTPKSITRNITSPSAEMTESTTANTNTQFKPSPRHSRMRRKAAKTQNSKRTRARKRSSNNHRRRHKPSNASSHCESSSEEMTSSDDEEEDEEEEEYEEEAEEEYETTSEESTSSGSNSTSTSTTPEGTDTNHLTSPRFPEAMPSIGSSMASTTNTTPRDRASSRHHYKNPMSLSAFSGVDSDGIDIGSFVDELNMPTIPENVSNFNSSQCSTPSPRSATNDSDQSILSEPVRKVTGFNKEPDPYTLAQRARGGDDKIDALNQDLNQKRDKDKSNKSKSRKGNHGKGKVKGSTRVESESEDDETLDDHEEEEKRMEPLEEQMHFAQEFLDKQQEGYMKYDDGHNKDNDSEADLKSETPDSDITDTNSPSVPCNHKENTPIHDIPLSIFSALSAHSMQMKQFETNDMMPNGNLTSLNAEPSVYESDSTDYQYDSNDDGEYGVIDTPKTKDSDDSSIGNNDTIIAIMKKRQNAISLNIPMADYGRARHNTSGSATSATSVATASTVMTDDMC